jgi:ABC-type multidrug transport system permease subunit
MTGQQQWVAYMTIVRKEVSRFLRIWPQTLLPSVITTTLYYVVFGKFIGSQIHPVGVYTYIQFIVPGLVMMAVITNAFGNVVSSFFGAKFQKQIEELLVSPITPFLVVAGFVTGGVLRGLLTGILVLLVAEVGGIKINTHDLIEYAFKKNVLIVSPTSFLAFLQTVLQGLKALQIEESAKEIQKKVAELGNHLKAYADYHDKLGKNLGTVVNQYNLSNKEFKKIDKDVMRISGEAIGIEVLEIEKPREE